MPSVLEIFLKGVKNKQNGVVQTISWLKNNVGYQELCKLVDDTSPTVKNYLNWFIGNSFPNSYVELGVYPMILEAKNLEVEIEWFFLALRGGYNKIKTFLELKSIYERKLLLGEYEEAESLLCQIEQNICFSLWSLEQRFLLAEMSEGLVENKKILEDFNNSNAKSDVKFLAFYFSERAESMGGVPNYPEKMLAAFDEYSNPDREMLISYYTFKLDPYHIYDDMDFKSIMENGFRYSLIDRYLTFLKICSVSKVSDSLFDLSKFKYKLNSFCSKINDPFFENISSLYNHNWKIRITDTTVNYLDLHLKYLQGDYESSFNLSSQLLLNDGSIFDAILIHAKSKVHIKIDSPLPKDCILYNIINTITEAYVKTPESNHTKALILKYAYMLEGLSIGINLLSYFASECSGVNDFNRSSTLIGPSTSPYFYKLLNVESQADFLLGQLSSSGNHPVYHYYYNIITNQNLQNLSIIKGNSLREMQIKIDVLISNSSYQSAIELLNDLIPKFKGFGYVYEKLLRRLFSSHIFIKDYDTAIFIFVRSFFESPDLTIKWDFNEIIDNNKKSKFKNIKPLIYLPLFYSLIKAEGVEIFNTIRLYLSSHGYDKPSELRFINEDRNHLVYFLNLICTPEILKYSSIFETSNEILLERIKILHFLQEIDVDHVSDYEKEILAITGKLIIFDGINKLDESKIYVNEELIYESEIKQHEHVFDRLLKLIKVYDDNNISSVNSAEFNSDLPGYFNPVTTSSKALLAPIINELFIIVKNEFLFNKSGLVNYLSTRIRHGIFESAIRTIFDKHHLITQKISSLGKYIDNDYWDTELINSKISKDKISKLKTELSEFSRKVDSLILDTLDKKLQVRTESKNKEGLFNFHYNSSTIFIDDMLYSDNVDFKKFVFGIYEILWQRTEENLASIRNYIKFDLLNQFKNLISELDENVNRIIKKNVFNSFFINTSVCVDNLAEELNNIANWFVRSNTQMSDLSLSEILDITHTYLARSSVQKKLLIEKKFDLDNKVKGQLYVSFTDLFLLFFNNVIKRSNYELDTITVTVSASIEYNEILHLRIANPIGQNIDIVTLNAELALLEKGYDDFDKLTSERKSGFVKAYNILRTDFKNNSNSMHYYVTTEREFVVELKINIKEIFV